jgi:hypothetical protein
MLLRGQLAGQFATRLTAGALGGLLLPWLLVSSMGQLGAAGQLIFLAASFGMLLLGEVLERMLFFKALSAPKMPGAVA